MRDETGSPDCRRTSRSCRQSSRPWSAASASNRRVMRVERCTADAAFASLRILGIDARSLRFIQCENIRLGRCVECGTLLLGQAFSYDTVPTTTRSVHLLAHGDELGRLLGRVGVRRGRAAWSPAAADLQREFAEAWRRNGARPAEVEERPRPVVRNGRRRRRFLSPEIRLRFQLCSAGRTSSLRRGFDAVSAATSLADVGDAAYSPANLSAQRVVLFCVRVFSAGR